MSMGKMFVADLLLEDSEKQGMIKKWEGKQARLQELERVCVRACAKKEDQSSASRMRMSDRALDACRRREVIKRNGARCRPRSEMRATSTVCPIAMAKTSPGTTGTHSTTRGQ